MPNITSTGDLPTVPIGAGQWVRAKLDQSAFEAATIYDQPDWSVTDSASLAYIKNKPTINTKRQETYLGTTGSTGYTVTYATAFSTTPDVQPQIQSGSATDTTSVRITASSTTGFTVVVRNRTDVIGLLPSYANVSGASVSVLVTER